MSKKYYPIFAKHSNRVQQPPTASTTRKRSRSRSWNLAESQPDPKSLKTDWPSSPRSSKDRVVNTPRGTSDGDMDTSISPIPIHRERSEALQPLSSSSGVTGAPLCSHRRANSGQSDPSTFRGAPLSHSHRGRGARIRPKLLLTQTNKKVHHPHVTHRGGSGNKENKENLLPSWKTALDSTLPDEALVDVTPNAKAALAHLISPKKNSFTAAGVRFTDSLRSELGLTSPQKHSLNRAIRSSNGGSPGLSIAPLSRRNLQASPRIPPLPLGALDSTIIEDESSDTPLLSSRTLSQNTRLTANKDDTVRPPRELQVPHSARALFPPTPQRPAPTSISGSTGQQNSRSGSSSPSESGSRPSPLFGDKPLSSKPGASRPATSTSTTSKTSGFPPAPRKSRGQQNRVGGSSDFGFAAPGPSPRFTKKPTPGRLPDTPVMMSPAFGDDSQDAPGTRARQRIGLLSRAASFDFGAFGKTFSGGASDFGSTDSQSSVRPTALCFDSQSDVNSRDSSSSRVPFCDVPGTPKFNYSQNDEKMTNSPSPLRTIADSQGQRNDSFESPETCSQDNLSQRSGRFTASTVRKKVRTTTSGRSHTPSRLFSKSSDPPPTPWNSLSKHSSKPPPSPFYRDPEDVDMSVSRTSSIGSLHISIPPPSASTDDDDEVNFLTPVNQNAPMLQRTVSEQVILEENKRHRCKRSAGEDTERALADIAAKGNYFLGLLKPSTHGNSNSRVERWRPLHGREPPMIAKKTNRRISAGRRGHNGTMLEDASVSVAKFSDAFKPIHNLGKGSFGEIKLCRSRIDGCYYAMKRIRRAGLAPDQFNEVFALAALQQLPEQCPHIVRYTSAFIEDGMLSIVFEYCAGGGLREDYLSQFDCSEEREKVLKTVADQMLQALSFIHNFGMAHMDVKTANLLRFDKDRHDLFKLCDFGLAVDLEEARKTGVAPDGDGRYIAPELFANRAFDLRKCDVYSLGCALLELASQEKLKNRGDNTYLPHVFAASSNPSEDFASRCNGFSPKFLSWLQALLVEDPQNRSSVPSALVTLHMLDVPSSAPSSTSNPSSMSSSYAYSSSSSSSSANCSTPSTSSRSPSSMPVDDSPSAVASQLSSLTIHSQNSRSAMSDPQVDEDAKDRQIRQLVTDSDAKNREILLLREQMKVLRMELTLHHQASQKDI